MLTDDLPPVGHAAYDAARKAILKKLTTDPEQYGERLHSPLHGLYKLKASHIRIAYHIEPAAHEVWVLLIGDRRTVWETRQGEILARLGDEQHTPEAGGPRTTAPRARRRR